MMRYHSKTVKHVLDGDHLYSLFFYPDWGHWVSLVTHTDMSRRTYSHIGRCLHLKYVRTEAEAREQAESFLADYRKTH